MNRVIKFRQPITKSDGSFVKWHFWGFVEGEYTTPAEYAYNHDTKKLSQQFTGLLDKKGKEIYEGDIVGYDDDPSLAVVLYYENQGRFSLKYKGRDFSAEITGWHIENFKVIGNTYENPELLT